MVKAIRNDEVNYAYTIDRRTVQKLLAKLECEGKILIVNEKIFLEEEQSYNGTFYTTIDCTNETFQAGIHGRSFSRSVIVRDFRPSVRESLMSGSREPVPNSKRNRQFAQSKIGSKTARKNKISRI